MRILKLGLISFFFIFLIVTLISLLIPSQIRISRANNLPNRRDAVFALLKNESAWHPAYTDSAAARGFAALKKSAVRLTDSTYVYVLEQPGRKPVTSGWQLYGTPAADSLTLQWYMDFQLGWYPWQKFSSLFYESTYGRMMEKGLADFRKQMMKE